MPNIIEITDFSAPELDVYARLTEVQLLNFDERVNEIARILGSIEPTAAQRNAAREMIEEYR